MILLRYLVFILILGFLALCLPNLRNELQWNDVNDGNLRAISNLLSTTPKRTLSPHRKKTPKFDKNAKVVFLNKYSEIEEIANRTGWPLVLMYSTGRLGNKIHNYAIGLALNKIFPNITVTLSEVIYKDLSAIIDQGSFPLPILSTNLSHHLPKDKILSLQPNQETADYGSYIFPGVSKNLGQRNILFTEGYTFDVFAGLENFLYQTIRLRNESARKATQFLDHVIKKHQSLTHESSVTPIGIHIRKKNYQRFAKHHFGVPSLPGIEYLKEAMEYYSFHVGSPIFIVCSDDMEYSRKMLSEFPRTYFSNNTLASDDFALLSSCTHSIMTMGSFGFWSSFMAGGTVLYPWYKLVETPPLTDPVYLKKSFRNFKGIPITFF